MPRNTSREGECPCSGCIIAPGCEFVARRLTDESIARVSGYSRLVHAREVSGEFRGTTATRIKGRFYRSQQG